MTDNILDNPLVGNPPVGNSPAANSPTGGNRSEKSPADEAQAAQDGILLTAGGDPGADPVLRSSMHRAALLAEKGAWDQAETVCNTLLATAPHLAAAWVNRGTLRRRTGRLQEAVSDVRRAVCLQPLLAAAYHQLGRCLKVWGCDWEADRVIETALMLRPDFVEALNNDGVHHLEQGEWSRALARFRQANAIRPLEPMVTFNLGLVLQGLGRLAEADTCFVRVEGLQDYPGVAFRRAVMLPAILMDMAMIPAVRARFRRKVDALMQQKPRLEDPLQACPWTNFFLAYHGQDDRDLQERASALYRAATPSLEEDWVVRREGGMGGRLKLAFASAYLCDHTIGALFRGLIAAIDRRRFKLFVFQLGPVNDSVSRAIAASVDVYRQLSPDLAQAREIIGKSEIDGLMYTDIGMDPFSYYLAHARLAPVQMTTWGHPVTSGIPNMDYFISQVHFDRHGAEADYSEQLVQLSYPPLAYAFPRFDFRGADRACFGLPEDRTLYLCPQSLFKFRPDFDSVLSEILARDPKGSLVILEGHRPIWWRQLAARLTRTVPALVARLLVLRRIGRDDFIRLMAVADVVLDTPVFCGGKTTLDALVAGQPVVTWPSLYLRGRLSYGFFKRMGIEETIAWSARDYVEIALRLGTDPDYRRDLQARVRGARRRVFDETDSVREFEAFVESALRSSPHG